MFEVGQVVRVLEPFAGSFPGEYSITEIRTHEDSQVAYILGEIGAFDQKFLEAVG
jgi:hypothetical protein